jgi:polysaccharide export outer membrane protein
VVTLIEYMTSRRRVVVCSVLIAASTLALAQAPQAVGQNAVPNPTQAFNSVRPDYELGPNDQIVVSLPELEEINQRPFRIDADGFINLPLIGRVRAAGLLVRGLEAEITTRARDFARDPHVTIQLVQFRSEVVYVIGSAFRIPGIYALQGGRTLVELLATVGGLQPNASRRIKVTRHSEYGPIPLPNAVEDPVRKVSTVEISLDSLTQDINPAEDLVLKAFDIITGEAAQPVYVNGEVTKPSAIQLGEQPSISVLQALTEAGGLTPSASRGIVRVLRPILGTSRRAEIDIDLRRVYSGQDNDFPLLPNDVLYVPRDNARAILLPVGTAMLTSLPYLIVTLAVSHVF